MNDKLTLLLSKIEEARCNAHVIRTNMPPDISAEHLGCIIEELSAIALDYAYTTEESATRALVQVGEVVTSIDLLGKMVQVLETENGYGIQLELEKSDYRELAAVVGQAEEKLHDR